MTGARGTDGVAARATSLDRIRIGISSWGSLPGFYPAGIKPAAKLGWYARFFSIVEVNVSFYRLVPQQTYVQWAEATPSSLTFDVKAFNELTHFRDSPQAETFTAFRASYTPLRELGRFGCVLYQFPPRFANTAASRSYLRRVATAMAGDLAAVEFRNASWLEPADAAEATFGLLDELGLAYTIADEPRIAGDTVPPLPAVTNSALAYIRLHGRNAEAWYRGGGGARYDYDYSPAELAEWAALARDLAHQAEAVHILFNNNARGAGTRNALALSQLLGMQTGEAPELPPEQGRLFADQS